MIGKKENLEKIPNCVFDPSNLTKQATVTAKGLDGGSPSVFRCTSTPMETGPIEACVET